MDGSWIPAYSFAKSCAQFSHNWNVAVPVKPIRINAKLFKEKFAFLMSCISDVFSLDTFFISGNGMKRTKIPITKIATPHTYNKIFNERFAATIAPIIKGSNSCAHDIENFVSIVAILDLGSKISTQAGITPVSRNEFAIPPKIAAIYATVIFGDIANPRKKII